MPTDMDVARISPGTNTASNSETITTRCSNATLIKPFLVVMVYECGRPAELCQVICVMNLRGGIGSFKKPQLFTSVTFKMGIPRKRMTYPSLSPPAPSRLLDLSRGRLVCTNRCGRCVRVTPPVVDAGQRRAHHGKRAERFDLKMICKKFKC